MLRFLDAYTIRARLFPAIFGAAPALAALLLLISWKTFELSNVVATLGELVLVYLLRYAQVASWREDNRRVSNGDQVSRVSFAQPAALTDQQIAARIVQESRQAYYATGHPCACPEGLARNGSRCGGRSAYSRPGGASPKCYVSDVTAAEIATYRAR
jgi:hypothetical protein